MVESRQSPRVKIRGKHAVERSPWRASRHRSVPPRVQARVGLGALSFTVLKGFSRRACVVSAYHCRCHADGAVYVRQSSDVRAARCDRLHARRTASRVRARFPRASAGPCAVALRALPAGIRVGEFGVQVQGRGLCRCITDIFPFPPSMSALTLRPVTGGGAFTVPLLGWILGDGSRSPTGTVRRRGAARARHTACAGALRGSGTPSVARRGPGTVRRYPPRARRPPLRPNSWPLGLQIRYGRC